MSDKKSLGQIGYEAYAAHTGWKSLATGQDLPQWDALPASIRIACGEAAVAIDVEGAMRRDSFGAEPPVLSKTESAIVKSGDVELGPWQTTVVNLVHDKKLFRAAKVVCKESVTMSTGIMLVMIGSKPQLPLTNPGVLSAFFSEDARGNEVQWDAWPGELSCQFLVRNVTDKPVTWSCEIRGVAVPK